MTRITYPDGQYLDYTYDAGGRRSSTTDHLGNTLTAQYDAVGRLVQLADGVGDPVVTYTYDSVGRLLTKTFGNGVVASHTYDAAGKVVRTENRDSVGGVISFLDYTYDQTGRVTSIDTEDGLWTYAHDAVGQLIRAQFASTNLDIPAQDLQYFYDPAGNRTRTVINGVTTDYTTNELNQYSQVGSVLFTYDDDGNLASRTDGANVTTYTYNAENRLTGASRGTDTWSYTYDALGRLATITRNGVTTHLVTDPNGIGTIVGEYDDGGNLITRYDYGFQALASYDSNGDVSFFTASGGGNVGGLTDASGAVQDTYFYDPFGNLIHSTGASDNPLQYVGLFGVREAGPGLYYMRNRFYSPELGQFLSEDPLRSITGVSRIYASNDPIGFIDPTGLYEGQGYDIGSSLLGIVGGILGVAVGVVAAPVTGGVSTVAAVAGAYSIGANIGNLFNAIVGTKPVLSDNLGQDLGKGIDAAAGTETFESIGAIADLAVGVLTARVASAQGVVSLAELLGPRAAQLGNILSHTGAFKTMAERLAAANRLLEGTGHRAVPVQVGDRIEIRIVAPRDPNDIVGPEGFGDEHFVTAPETLPYTIRFENAEDATAPAQQVTVIQQLDSDLDFRTFRVGDFGFGDFRFTLPENRAFFNQRLDLTEDLGFLLDVAAGVNVATGEAFWSITTIDPDTGDIPENPLIGYLPPNDEEGAGEGFFSYTIRSRRDVATGDVIDAEARIVFDTQGPIDTPPIFNTIDAGVPTSQVEALPVIAPRSDFQVEWSGSDDARGSAISGYTIFVSDNGARYAPWLENTDLAEATYSGQEGHTYEFYSTALDNAGNAEVAPATPDTQTLALGGGLVVEAGANQTVDEGTTVSLAPATFTDPTTDTHTAELDWGDGTIEAGVVDETLGTVAGSHVYADNGAFTIMVTVVGDNGDMPGDTLMVLVNNVAPTIEAGVDQTVNQGAEVSLAPATFHDQGTLDIHTATIDWGDGTAADVGTVTETPFGPPGSTTGADGTVSGSHSYTDIGVFTTTVTVCDDDLDCTSDTFVVLVLLPGVIIAPPPPPPPPAAVVVSIAVAPSSSTIGVGGTLQFTALAIFDTGATIAITPTWSSSDSSIAQINATGLAIGIAPGTVTITATDPASGITGTATLTISNEVQETSPELMTTIDTTITVTEEELTAATGAATTAIGTGVEITADPIEIGSAVVGIGLEIPATGVTAGQAITGDLDLTMENLALDTTDGQGTATIDLSGGLSVTGDATLTVTDNGIAVAIEEPQLVFEPEAPDATLLAGGSGIVTEVDVAFNVDLEDLPDGASLAVQFAKDATAFVADPGATFQLAAQQTGGVIQNVADDVAFVVKVTKSVITNQDLGTNTMTMTVSKVWYDQKLEQGKDIVITKIDDDNNVFTVTATCIVTGSTVSCTAEFTGAAGGFSVFGLLAVASTSTPIPTAIPSLSQWGLIGMAGFFALVVLVGIGMQARTRRKAGYPR